jgi:putative phosphoesterase
VKIGLISDTHGDAEAWRRAMGIFGACDLILHAGDHLYNGAFNPVLPTYDPKRLALEMNECPIPILHARGNCDSEVDQLALKDPIMTPYVFCRLEGLNILIVHGDAAEEMELVETARGYGAGLLVRGHTHIHGIWEHGDLLVCNPGSPSLPKGDGLPSVAVLESGKIILYNLRDGGEISRQVMP